MATGVNGREKHGPNAKTARKPHRDPHSLPPNDTSALLTYEGKLDESKALKPLNTSFVEVTADQDAARRGIRPNAVVLSDNIFAIHGLLAQGKRAQLIYLDPPFCTGLEFQSRQLKHAYVDKLGEAAYLEFIRRRLILLRELLTSDGSIYVHIGYQMVAHLKVLLDEVFGRRNYRNLIVRRKCSSKNFTRNQYANLNDYILFYTRSSQYKWNNPAEKPEADWIAKEYDKIDSRGRYKLVPVHAPGTRHGETGKAWRGKNPPPGKHWQYAPSKLDELDAAGEIHWSRTGNPRRKVYLQPDKTVPFTDYWSNFRDAHHQSIRVTGYPTEKNLDMLKTIVEASSDPGDLVVDPFCGSGTTLQAAHDLGRQWIGIDESFEAIQATLGRMTQGVQRMGDYVNVARQEQTTPMLFEDRPSFSLLIDSEIYELYSRDVHSLVEV